MGSTRRRAGACRRTSTLTAPRSGRGGTTSGCSVIANGMSTVLSGTSALLTKLRSEGIVRVPGMPTAHVDAMWASVRHGQRYAGHVKREGRPYAGMPISCWGMHDVILAPHVWEWALSFTAMAGVYLDTDPLLYSINVFESNPSSLEPHPG